MTGINSSMAISCRYPIYNPQSTSAVNRFFQGYFYWGNKQYRVEHIAQDSKTMTVVEERLPWTASQVLRTALKVFSLATILMPIIGLIYLAVSCYKRDGYEFLVRAPANAATAPTPQIDSSDDDSGEEIQEDSSEEDVPPIDYTLHFEAAINATPIPKGPSQAFMRDLLNQLFNGVDKWDSARGKADFINHILKDKDFIIEQSMKKIDDSPVFLAARRVHFEASFDASFADKTNGIVDTLLGKIKDYQYLDPFVETLVMETLKELSKTDPYFAPIVLKKAEAFLQDAHNMIIGPASCLKFFRILNALADPAILGTTVDEYLDKQKVLSAPPLPAQPPSRTLVFSSNKQAKEVLEPQPREKSIRDKVLTMIPEDEEQSTTQTLLVAMKKVMQTLNNYDFTYYVDLLDLMYAKSLIDEFCEKHDTIVSVQTLAELVDQLDPLLSGNTALEEGDDYYKKLQESFEAIATKASNQAILNTLELTPLSWNYNRIAALLGLKGMQIENATENDAMVAQAAQWEEINKI